MSARPPLNEPVKPTARTRGWRTRADPIRVPASKSSENVPAGNPHCCDCLGKRAAGKLAGAGMRRVRLHDNGIAGGEGRCGIAAGYGECEGEVAGAEDGHRAERAQHRADVRFWRSALGIGSVDASHDPGTLFGNAGEEPELVAGAGDFAFEPWGRQRGFEMRALNEVVGCGVDGVCHGAEQLCAVGAGRCCQERRGCGCAFDCRVELRFCG